MTRRAPARGFTLVEVMIVVAILGVLVTLAVVFMRPRTTPHDAAHRFAGIVQEASRRAVKAGMVRPQVTVALGFRQRTRLTATASGSTVTFALEELFEDPAPSTSANWVTVQQQTVPARVVAHSYAMGVGSYATVSPAPTASWSTFTLNCFPNGTCDAATVFFEAAPGVGGAGRQARVSVMPLGTATYVRPDWN